MSDKYQLYQGDCISFMRGMDAGSVDAVITDPPYGVDYKYQSYDDSKNNLSLLVAGLKEQSRRKSRDYVLKPRRRNHRAGVQVPSVKLLHPSRLCNLSHGYLTSIF